MQKLILGLIALAVAGAIAIGGRYLVVQQATKQITDSTEQMTERMLARTQAMQAELAARQAVQAKADAKRRKYQSVVGCANNAAGDRCTCFDAKAQQVPDIPDDICHKVVDGGLNWLRQAAE